MSGAGKKCDRRETLAPISDALRRPTVGSWDVEEGTVGRFRAYRLTQNSLWYWQRIESSAGFSAPNLSRCSHSGGHRPFKRSRPLAFCLLTESPGKPVSFGSGIW